MRKSREERLDMEDINNKSEKIKREDVQQRHLPDDVIIQHILPYLPIKPLTRFKAVSKHWYSSISSPNFILNYTEKPLFSHPGPPIESLFIHSGNDFYLYSCSTNHDYDNVVESAESSNNLVKLNVNFAADESDDISLVGSSNGLVCLGEKYGKYFILYNPATNRYHKYLTLFENFLSVKWGFGYVTSLGDFKVIQVTQNLNSGSWFCVYSLKSNTWKKIELDFYGYLVLEQPKLVNETLYWNALVASTKELRIIAFDLSLHTIELFTHMSLPLLRRQLCVMGGCLSKYAFNSENELVIDVLKRPGDVVSECFSCQFRCSDIHDLIGFTKNGKIIVVLQNPKMLALVDSSSRKRILTYEGPKRLEIDSYVPSQISPHPRD